MRRFRLWVVIGVVTTTVVGAGVIHAATSGSPSVRLATSGDVPTSQGPIANDTVDSITTSTELATPTSTTLAKQTATVPSRATTTAQPVATTVRPTTTTVPSGPDTGHARIWVQNDYGAAVTVHVGDESDNTWTLQPGAKAGPWDLTTSLEHGDGAGVARADNPACGAADGGGENYFVGGHQYRLVVGTRSTDCENGPGPELFIHDLTTGGTRSI